MYNGQPKPNLRHKRKVLSGLEGLLEIVGLEVMAEGVRAGTHSEGWRERIPDCRSYNIENAVIMLYDKKDIISVLLIPEI